MSMLLHFFRRSAAVHYHFPGTSSWQDVLCEALHCVLVQLFPQLHVPYLISKCHAMCTSSVLLCGISLPPPFVLHISCTLLFARATISKRHNRYKFMFFLQENCMKLFKRKLHPIQTALTSQRSATKAKSSFCTVSGKSRTCPNTIEFHTISIRRLSQMREKYVNC